MATKTIHTCDYCGWEITEAGGVGVKIVMFRRGEAIIEHGWPELCTGCADRVRDHIKEALAQLGDDCHDH